MKRDYKFPMCDSIFNKLHIMSLLVILLLSKAPNIFIPHEMTKKAIVKDQDSYCQRTKELLPKI